LALKNETRISPVDVLAAARVVLSRYSKYWQDVQEHRLRQFSEEISYIYKDQGVVVDLGGGDGLRAAICAQLGMKAYNVDVYELNVSISDHMPAGFLDEFRAATEVARSNGVQFELADVISWRTDMEGIDAVMSFDALEHLHHSPRDLFRHLVDRMAIGGRFFIGAPNAANIAKRLRVLAGKNAFSRMEDWYYVPLFTGHVREPVVSDLREIADDLSLDAVVFGANWLGFERMGQGSVIAHLADTILRPFPSLCSDIYMLGTKRR
jgi:SAM-dependent methyltransferase